MGLFCTFAVIGNRVPGGGNVDQVLSIAQAEVGVREVGQNGGKRVTEYLAYTGIRVPAPYCAAFVSFVFWKAGYAVPRTAWSPALFPAGRLVGSGSLGSGSVRHDGKGLVFGIYFPDLKRIAHVGLVESVRGDWLTTIEANTNVEGSREGQGVYRRLRHKRTIAKYANWL